ncbi:conjugative transfer ATPase [Serratia fonticola]|uniref:conjugative transfer ATPase n=1 Tax=Serratia fonticola TaxID=47917 RepID=UPI0008FCFD9B|nr:conjugative transfer ATPase [Serratia fonticola]OIX95213.1 conjugative transfer ATPase [Serratia fonticola]QCR63000.1 conjugative transfer ATPase [Serratia fonticola]
MKNPFTFRQSAGKYPDELRPTVEGHECLRRGDGPQLTERQHEKLYETSPSFIQFLPWTEFLTDGDCLLLDDGRSVGAVYEVIPVSTEGRPLTRLEEIRDVVEDALQDAPDELADNPWVIQFYCQDESDVDTWLDTLRGYVKPWAQGTAFTEAWLGEMARHYRGINRSDGLFEDQQVTGLPWRGIQRRTRMVVYRRTGSKENGRLSPVEHLNQVCGRLVAALAGGEIRCERQNGAQIHAWLLRWFNPDPPFDPAAFAVGARYCDPTPKRPGDLPLLPVDFAESLLFTSPRSDVENAVWWFDNRPHRVVMVEKLREVPAVGHLTGERKSGKHHRALLDGMPEGTTLMLTLVVADQDGIRDHFARLAKSAVGDSTAARETRQRLREVTPQHSTAHKIYRSSLGFYLSAPDLATLEQRNLALESVLLNHQLQPVRPEHEVAPLNTWLRWLPMCFDPASDKKHWYTQLQFVQHLAHLVPLYGRASGTGHPGYSFFNRGGGLVTFDPLTKQDRQENAHMLILGPTGAGKSATATGMFAQLMAIYRPRMVVVEVGNSFGPFGDYCKTLGLTVNKVSIKPGSGVSLAPFADAHRLLALNPVIDGSDLPDLTEGDDDEDSERDIMGEMEIIARLMITGGEPAEEALMTRANRGMLREAIMMAAKTTHEAQRQMLPEDLRDALNALARDTSLDSRGQPMRSPQMRERAADMAAAMSLFTSGFDGEVFNRPGDPWPEADLTIVDLGVFARENYQAQMAVAYISLMNRVNAIAERDQYEDRQIVMPTDEAHVITTNPLLSPYVTKITKMWRKLGAWLWLLTQNMKDFPDAAERMLNMCEWWLCLVMPPNEVEQIARFKTLTDEQRLMLLSASKQDRAYTEGVVLSARLQTLFRVVPPSLYLALAMTEKDEKAERRALMEAHGITELEAVVRVARALDVKRGIMPAEEGR